MEKQGNRTGREKPLMTNSAFDGRPYAGNPHVRFDEGDGASAKPRRSSLLYKRTTWLLLSGVMAVASVQGADSVSEGGPFNLNSSVEPFLRVAFAA